MKIRNIAFCFALSALTACSGGGGNSDDGGVSNGNNTDSSNGSNNSNNNENSGNGVGISTEATLSTDNSKDAGLMASAAAKQAIANQSAPDLPSSPFKTSHSAKPAISSSPNPSEFATEASNVCSSGSGIVCADVG